MISPTTTAAAAAHISGQRHPDTGAPSRCDSSRDLAIAAKPNASIRAIAGPVACQPIGHPSRRMTRISTTESTTCNAIIARLMYMLRWRAT